MIKSYLLFSTIFFLIDTIYLISAKILFNAQIKAVQKRDLELNFISTLLCYILLTTGIYYFAIYKKLSIIETAILGLFVYGVYETTTHAIFKEWKWTTVLMDTLWGAILFSTSVYLHKKLIKYI